MKKLIVACAIALLAGCATKEKEQYTAPSVVAVKTSLERLKPHVTNSTGITAIQDVISAIDTYEAQVDQQSKELAKAQNDAIYWRGKHEKGLKELWTWRMIALSAILCVVVYVGIKTSWKLLV
jgi:hypothetical protein